jgi:hypothetical protein
MRLLRIVRRPTGLPSSPHTSTAAQTSHALGTVEVWRAVRRAEKDWDGDAMGRSPREGTWVCGAAEHVARAETFSAGTEMRRLGSTLQTHGPQVAKATRGDGHAPAQHCRALPHARLHARHPKVFHPTCELKAAEEQWSATSVLVTPQVSSLPLLCTINCDSSSSLAGSRRGAIRGASTCRTYAQKRIRVPTTSHTHTSCPRRLVFTGD